MEFFERPANVASMTLEGALRGRLLRGRLPAALVAAICILAGPVASASATGGARPGRRVRIGSAPHLPAGTRAVAGAVRVNSLQISVALTPRDPAAMAQYAAAVSDPASPDYHHYLTTAEFRSRFAPTAATDSQVETALRASGLHPGALTSNGLALQVRASQAAVEKAFSVTFAQARLATGKDVVYNVQAPSVASTIAADVQAVVGLNGLAHEQPAIARRDGTIPDPLLDTAEQKGPRADAASSQTGGPQACAAAASAPSSDPTYASGAYTANQIATAYSYPNLYDSGDEGAGVTVALYELEPNLTSDIAAYQKCYGTHTSVSYVKVDGGAPSDPSEGGPAGEGEAALDIEQLIGLAPKVNILVYQGPNSDLDSPGSGPYDVLAEIVSQDRAQVVSTSWGDCESDVGQQDITAESDLFQEAAIQGQTVVAAAGDDGSEDCYYPPQQDDESLAVDDPASQPFVTGAGGTTMTAIGPAPTQTVWNDGAKYGGGGGGLSGFWSMPSYQSNAASDLNVIQADSSKEGCGPTAQEPSYPYCREVPDVSADADEDTGYLIYYNGTGVTAGPEGWQAIGGTSAAAPLWASIFALADADSACSSPIGFANGALYDLGSASQDTYFDDITTGDNDILDANGKLFPATTGYDMASGLGTPIADELVPALCGQTVKVSDPGDRHAFEGASIDVQLHAKLGSGLTGSSVRYRASDLPAGLKLNASTGRITGRPTRPSVKTVTVDAYTANEIYGAAKFTWTIEGRPTVTGISLTKATSHTPQLSFTVKSGADEPALRTIRIELPSGLDPTASLNLLRVLGKHGGALKHRASRRGRVVTLTLSIHESSVKLVFTPGSLTDDASIRADAQRADPVPVKVLVTPVDADGGKSSLKPSVRPRP